MLFFNPAIPSKPQNIAKIICNIIFLSKTEYW